MKKELLDALKTKFQGVSDSILGRIADKYAKTVTTTEQVKTTVEGLTIQQVIESYGDSRATEASNTARENAVKDYESRYGLKDGVKTTNTTKGGEQQKGGNATNSTPGGTDETPVWAKTLIERIDRMENAKTTETRKQQLEAVIGKLPETMRKAYERIPLDKYNEEEFGTMLNEITTEVESIANDTALKGAVFGKPPVSTGNTTTTELTEAQKAAISHREGVPAAGEQPF